MIYEIFININSSLQLERGVREYRETKSEDDHSVCSRKGSIGTYKIYNRALDTDKPLTNGNGGRFYTKDKKNLKGYGKILDDISEKWIDDAIKVLTKQKDELGSKWGIVND